MIHTKYILSSFCVFMISTLIFPSADREEFDFDMLYDGDFDEEFCVHSITFGQSEKSFDYFSLQSESLSIPSFIFVDADNDSEICSTLTQSPLLPSHDCINRVPTACIPIVKDQYKKKIAQRNLEAKQSGLSMNRSILATIKDSRVQAFYRQVYTLDNAMNRFIGMVKILQRQQQEMLDNQHSLLCDTMEQNLKKQRKHALSESARLQCQCEEAFMQHEDFMPYQGNLDNQIIMIAILNKISHKRLCLVF